MSNPIYDDWPANAAGAAGNAGDAGAAAQQRALAAAWRQIDRLTSENDWLRDTKGQIAELQRLRAERADLLAHLRPTPLLDLSLADDVTCDCAEDSREHLLDCPRGLLLYLTLLAEKIEKEARQSNE